MSAVISPAEVEAQMMSVLNRIAEGIDHRSRYYQQWLDADADYDHAYALAYHSATGPAHALRYEAELKTYEERKKRDLADAAYKHAERRAKALEAELSALQSVLKSILATYGAAGVNER